MTATNFEINSGGGVGSGAASGGSANSSTMAHYNSPGAGGGGASVAATGNVASAASQAADYGTGVTANSNVAALLIQPNSPSSSSSTSKNNGDSTFEPTVDMMVNDFDDEQTLEEEEALAAREAEDPSAELSNLQKESDMPIEELLALYNCAGPAAMGSTFTTGNTSSTATGIGKRGMSAATSSLRGGNAAPASSQSLAGTVTTAASKSRRIASTSSSRDGAMGGTSSTRENGLTDDLDEDDFDEDDDDEDEIKETSKLRKLYPETYGGNEKRLLRTISRQQSDEEDDGDYSPDEDEFKKTIMVGSEFQAVIPEGFFKYDDVLPYENEDKLQWDPSRIAETSTEEYLFNVLRAKQQQQQQNGTNGATSLPNQLVSVDSIQVGSHLRDDEQALYLLLQCGHNSDEALRRKRINSVPSSEQMSSWSEDECRNFESGIRIYGKDFHTIQQTKVHTRSVGELVQFYYLWKKTERHDIFANKARLEKKKYSLHPGLTDYMDRFLEEQDVGGGNGSSSTIGGQTGGAAAGSSSSGSSMTLRDRSLSPGFHSVTSSAQHNRKHPSLSSTSLPAATTTTTLSQEINQTKSDYKSTNSSTKSKERHVDDEENDADDDENYDEDSDNRDRARKKNSHIDIGAGGGGAGVMISDPAETAAT